MEHYLQRSYPSEYKRYRQHQFIIISIEGSSIFWKASSISLYTLLPVLLSNSRHRITFVLPLLPICHCTYCSVYLHLKVAAKPPYLSRSAVEIGVIKQPRSQGLSLTDQQDAHDPANCAKSPIRSNILNRTFKINYQSS